MSTITMSQVTELADPKLKAIAKRVLRTLQVETEKAVAHLAEPANFPIADDPNSTEQILLARFKELNQTKQQAAFIRVMASVKANEAARKAHYGDLAAVNLRAANAVATQAHLLQLPATLRFPASHLLRLKKIHGHILVPHMVEKFVEQPAGLTPQQTTNRLALRIHRVRCVDETDPEFIGDDEIALGGLTVDESGDMGKVSQFMVKNDFDDGEVKIYNPPKQFTAFNLLEGGNKWPKSYAVTLILAEKDMGGLDSFIHKLWNKVKGHVLQYVGAAVGGAIGSVVPGLGNLVGAMVGWALGAFIEWLLGLFQDDIFRPVTVNISIPSLNARWSGGKTNSPLSVVGFKGFGGFYRVAFDWQLLA